MCALSEFGDLFSIVRITCFVAGWKISQPTLTHTSSLIGRKFVT